MGYKRTIRSWDERVQGAVPLLLICRGFEAEYNIRAQDQRRRTNGVLTLLQIDEREDGQHQDSVSMLIAINQMEARGRYSKRCAAVSK